MSAEITVRDLIDRLGEGPTVLVRGIVWHVSGVKQQADRTDGTMRVQLKIMRQDAQDGTTKRMVLDVELNDTIQLAQGPTA
jgi:hypothetical protein